MPKRFDCEDEPNEFMAMPCRCDCGKWFDLHDGYSQKEGYKIICRECKESEEEENDKGNNKRTESRRVRRNRR